MEGFNCSYIHSGALNKRSQTIASSEALAKRKQRTEFQCRFVSALPKPYVSIQDFYREFHLGLCLGAHKNIVSTYDVAFETSGFYVFTQEYAPLGK